MKYAIFALVASLGVPAMTACAVSSERWRGRLLSLLIFMTAVGGPTKLNFVSMETYRGPDRGFEVTLVDLIAFALVLALLLKAPGRLCWLPYNSVWMAVGLGVALVSSAGSPQPLYSAFTLFKLLRLYLVYWCVVNCLRTGTDRHYVWLGFVGVGVFVTALALRQKYLQGIYRVSGPFDHSNTIPLYLNLVMPALILWGLCDRRLSSRQVLLSSGVALGMLFSVAATFSRAGTALAVMALAGALTFANLRFRSVRVTVASLLVLLLMVAGAVKAAGSFIERIKSAPESSAGAREEFNYAAKLMLQDRLFGVGVNNFSYVLTNTPKYNEHIVIMANEEEAGVAHHIYLLTAAETGIPGLLVFLTVILRFWWLAGRAGWRARSLEGMLLLGLCLGATTLHLSGFLEWAFRITPVSYMFVVTSAVIAALAEAVRQRPAGRPRILPAARRPAGAMA